MKIRRPGNLHDFRDLKRWQRASPGLRILSRATSDLMNEQTHACTKCVLVVEDEPLLRLMAGDMVEDAGLQPLFARNADEAIAILESRTDICVVFTDVRMPGSMDGVRLCHAVRDRWPPIKLLIVSGHLIDDPELPADARFIRKPYASDGIISTLREFAGCADP